MIALNIIFNDENYLDKIELDTDSFYELLKTKDYPKTSQPSPAQFYDVYSKFDKNDEILVITLSSKLSGTMQSAFIASDEITSKIKIIDSSTVAIALKSIVLKAIEYRDNGYSFEEIIIEVEKLINKSVLYAGFNTLEYLIAGGRISKVAGIAGTIFKIKPLITINDGKIEMVKKFRGFNTLISNLLEIVENDDIDRNLPIILGYTKDDEVARSVKNKLEEKGFYISEICDVGVAVGVHAGEGAIAISYFKK